MKDIVNNNVADKKCLTRLVNNFSRKHDNNPNNTDPITCNSFLYLLSKYTGLKLKLYNNITIMYHNEYLN